MASINWTTQGGKEIVIEARGYGSYQVTLDGRDIGNNGMITKAAGIPNAAYREGIRALIMAQQTVALTAERRDALLALDAEVTAARKVERDATPLAQLEQLEGALERARDAVTMRYDRADGANPAPLYAVAHAAEQALAAWIAANRAEYDTIMTERRATADADRAERRAIYGGERIARGED